MKGGRREMGDDLRSLMAVNRDHWDELVPLHRDSAFYDQEGFLNGRNSVDDIAMGLLGDVTGKRLLHLQCHFGMDTLSLARLGAVVTGVDFSPPAIEAARMLAAELDLDARFVESNIYDLPADHDGRYEIVFTSHGTITWLPDIRGWAAVIARCLEPGGRLVFLDTHPIAWGFKQEDVDDFVFEFGYFNDDRTFAFSSEYSYASDETSPLVRNQETREWHHRLDQIINALVGAGLAVEQLSEYPQIAWRMLPFLEKGDDGWWRIPAGYQQVPLMLSIVAGRPATSTSETT